MTSILKKVYIDKLNDIVNKYSNAYHRTLKIKPIDVKTTTYIDFDIEDNDKDPKFKVGDHVRISKFKKKKMWKVTFQIGLTKFLSLKELKTVFSGHM